MVRIRLNRNVHEDRNSNENRKSDFHRATSLPESVLTDAFTIIEKRIVCATSITTNLITVRQRDKMCVRRFQQDNSFYRSPAEQDVVNGTIGRLF